MTNDVNYFNFSVSSVQYELYIQIKQIIHRTNLLHRLQRRRNKRKTVLLADYSRALIV